jgi:hypothetical protein
MMGHVMEHVTIDSVDEVRVRPDGFQMTLKLDREPDELLREVIQGWPYGMPGLRELQVVRGHMVVSTELDADAPARALTWLLRGPEPALEAMQAQARRLREAEQEALVKAEEAFHTSR